MAIIEDIAEIREMVRFYFSGQEGFEICFAVESAAKIPMQKIPELDIVLCDIGLPGKSGMETTWLLRQKKQKVHVVMFTVLEDKDTIFQALQAGATGYLLKGTPLPKIKQALLDVLNGGAAMSPIIAKKVLDYFKPAKQSVLTPQEENVMRYIRKGLTNKQVGEKMEISANTVKFHIKNIYEKLQVKSRMELLNYYK